MKILIADDEYSARYALRKLFSGQNRTILEAENGKRAIEIIESESPDLVFLDLNMPELDGIGVLAELRSRCLVEFPEIIIVTASDTVANAVECIRLGAADFITKPYEIERVRAILLRAEKRVDLLLRLAELQQQIETQPETGTFDGMLGTSKASQQLFSRIAKAAVTNLPILIRGESGTGKELVARSLHKRSLRAAGPFVAVNTAAINESLIESELFGHVKGAFTGADREREGVFRQADRGTLFLDEIGDMPMKIQTRLLRVIQEGIVQPVGSEKSFHVDVRVISATHQPLLECIAQKMFREDLYFRLKGIELVVPPLRQRHEDILLIANHALPEGMLFAADAAMNLISHPWPGNIRELLQKVQAAAAMAESSTITSRDLGLVENSRESDPMPFSEYMGLPLSEAKATLVDRFERAAIAHALDAAGGNISAAARQLGMHRQSLQQKMKQLEMNAGSDE